MTEFGPCQGLLDCKGSTWCLHDKLQSPFGRLCGIFSFHSNVFPPLSPQELVSALLFVVFGSQNLFHWLLESIQNQHYVVGRTHHRELVRVNNGNDGNHLGISSDTSWLGALLQESLD